jgi:hypothetical protein
MFFEEVPVQKGEMLGSVLSQYGFLPSDRDRILGNSHNRHIDPNMPEGAKFTGSNKIYLPIDLSTLVINAKAAIDKENGLRPRKIDSITGVLGPIICTHGVQIKLSRSIRPCQRIRWVQTVTKTDIRQPKRSFVDLGGNRLPFHNTTTFDNPNSSPRTFDDLPCGMSSETNTSLDFEAVLSAVVWTGKRITIASARHYHFQIRRGGNIDLKKPFLAPATTLQILDQIKILRKGINQLKQNTGPHNDYRLPPANGSINGDKMQTMRRTYTVVSGDTLVKISKRFYGDGGQWRKIYNANIHIIGPNPDRIFPGQTYVIPL